MKFKENSGAMDSKNYLRLKDKESVKGLFVGELYEFRKHWDHEKKRSYLCSEDNKCAHCAAGLKSSFGFRANFIVKEGETYTARIFEQGWAVYEIMKNLNTEYDLEKHLVKISRTGTGFDTVHTIIPIPNGIVTPELAKKLVAVILQDIRHKDEPERVEHSNGKAAPSAADNFVPDPAFDSDEQIPF